MGRAFNRLQKQVSERRQERDRYLPQAVRLRNMEVMLLELGAYVVQNFATDADSPTDSAFVGAFTEFRKALERTVP